MKAAVCLATAILVVCATALHGRAQRHSLLEDPGGPTLGNANALYLQPPIYDGCAAALAGFPAGTSSSWNVAPFYGAPLRSKVEGGPGAWSVIGPTSRVDVTTVGASLSIRLTQLDSGKGDGTGIGEGCTSRCLGYEGEADLNLSPNQWQVDAHGRAFPVLSEPSGPGAARSGFLSWQDAPRLSELSRLHLQVTSKLIGYSTGDRCPLGATCNFPTILYGVVFQNGADGGVLTETFFYQVVVFDPRQPLAGIKGGWFARCNIEEALNPTCGGAATSDFPALMLCGASDGVALPRYGHEGLEPGVWRSYDIDILPRVVALIREGPPPERSGPMDHDIADWKPVGLYISSATNGESTIVSEHRGIDLRYDRR